ncbi:AraC family transcriptional regulator [Falsochrobactrum ovis]|uniref:AraC family transcriptional regulator n=1 Tax=Falsochrobactrum ovis TaxID=1293442 RepID=A0A364JW60_9HYPH|nr:AraC family transcriptional regulator [Falsochrobactrum ovis]
MILMMQSHKSDDAGVFLGGKDTGEDTILVQAVGPFRTGLSPAGLEVCVPQKALALILLEPIRQLRWSSSDEADNCASCAAETVFYIPANHSIAFTWPESVQFLSVTIDEGFVVGGKADHTHSREGEKPDNIVRFTSKQCLQMSQIITQQLQEGETEESNYLWSLHSVLVNLVIKNAVYAQNVGGTQSGLSAYACGQIEAYLKENFRKPVSVPDMANMLGISAGHFATCFRESFGQTPHQYLTRLRLDEAERCLRETDMPISEIAARLSFSSQSHLTTALRKYRHLTPGEIRRRGKQRSRR